MSATTHGITHDFGAPRSNPLQTQGKCTRKPLLATQGRGQFEKKGEEKP